MRTSLDSKYAKWDRVEEYEPSEEEMDALLSEAELKAKREKKRDELIQKELDGYKEIDEKLKRAEKLPARTSTDYEPRAEPTSWSSGRERRKADESDVRKAREAVGAVEAMLGQLAADEEFQADLRRPAFDTALKHWTNEARLPPSEARALFDEESFEYQQYLKPGLAKITRLQAACRTAGIGVPIDAIRKRRSTIFEPKPKPPTEAEKRLAEKERREKARKEFEEKLMADLPPPQPFSWRKLGRQLVIQLFLMASVMLYFHFVMRPNLEKQIKEAELAHRQTQDADAITFPDDASEYVEIGGAASEATTDEL
mmetsp:Transcript_11984/g.38107  ORF Transcript_11984/g.38107 Transcript_11984/m.38107 type:complete len:313 (+) Transcript_11984:53-991(+)